jgi:protein-tyrosine phosphatase
VYIHCAAGVGRAPTTVAAYLVSTGLTPDEAWALIRRTRPFIRPKVVQYEQLDQFYEWIT